MRIYNAGNMLEIIGAQYISRKHPIWVQLDQRSLVWVRTHLQSRQHLLMISSRVICSKILRIRMCWAIWKAHNEFVFHTNVPDPNQMSSEFYLQVPTTLMQPITTGRPPPPLLQMGSLSPLAFLFPRSK